MTTSTPTKNYDLPASQKTAPAVRPFSLFAQDPFRSFESMRQMMDSLFEARGFPGFATDLEPAINLFEKDGTYTVECALPGYKKDDITVEARGDQVTISGSYSQEKTEDKNRYHRHELRHGSFSRTIALPQEVDPDHVTANLENGMLKVTLQPTKTIASKKIPVTG